MLYILLLKSFFQMGGGRRKERSESSWDAVSATQGSTITPARTPLGLCPEQSPFFCPANPQRRNWCHRSHYGMTILWKPPAASSQCQPNSGTQSVHQIMGSECQQNQAAHTALGVPDGHSSGKATVTNTKAAQHSTGTNWCRLGMRSKSPLPGALCQFNTQTLLDLSIFGQTSSAFGPTGMNWAAQEKHRTNTVLC